MGGNEPVREREFDRYARETDRRLAALEGWRDRHEGAHDEDDDDDETRRRWSWQQVTAWASVAAVLASAWVAVVGR